jgi:hypothetical protein
MLEALGLYLAIDAVLSVIVLALAYKKRHLIKDHLRQWLEITTYRNLVPVTAGEVRQIVESMNAEDLYDDEPLETEYLGKGLSLADEVEDEQ